jgi:hypothetical protein
VPPDPLHAAITQGGTQIVIAPRTF